MNEPFSSIKIKMLGDAGFHPTELQKSYLKLIEFVKKVSVMNTLSIRTCAHIRADAKDLLREIGEL